jgi:hypothetical protein
MTTTINNSTFTIPDGSIGNAAINSSAGIETSKLESRTSQAFPVPFNAMFVWDAVQNNLPSAGANDDLGLITGTWGTDSPTLQTGDLKAAGATNRYAGFLVQVPQNYQDAATFAIRLRGGMITTVSDTSAEIDLELYVVDKDGGVGSDICQTAAATINSLTKANVDFTIDATAIDPGDLLFGRIKIAINDAATGTAVIGECSHAEIRCTTRG